VTDPSLSRRRALGVAVVGGLSLPVLAACGGGGGSSSSTAADPGTNRTPTRRPGGGSSSSSADALVATAQVAVGGGVVLSDQNVVVTQPKKGTFEGFSATCTHQGCILAGVAGGTINCACHGSQFSITTGANVTGPMGSPAGSVAPLPKVSIRVEGADVVRA
jgi:nitrite reductase/ring-hydroxylating ferredoxin subunit